MENNQLSFYVNPTGEANPDSLLSLKEVKQVLADERKFFEQEAEFHIKRYHNVKRLSSDSQIPSITSSWSDVAPSFTGGNHSQVENYAIKNVLAEEWLNTFHVALDLIDPMHQQLIQEKYLKSIYPRIDDIVYQELCYSRATYYRIKRNALEEFGRTLFGLFNKNKKKQRRKNKCI